MFRAMTGCHMTQHWLGRILVISPIAILCSCSGLTPPGAIAVEGDVDAICATVPASAAVSMSPSSSLPAPLAGRPLPDHAPDATIGRAPISPASPNEQTQAVGLGQTATKTLRTGDRPGAVQWISSTAALAARNQAVPLDKPTNSNRKDTTSTDDPSWLVDAIDPNCPCQRDNDDHSYCNCGQCGSGDGRPEGLLGPWPPDEYICDGGDRETRVVVNSDLEVSGLNLEDTVAHYDTLDGRIIVTPSNNVCIYAPRFAAVRKIIRASEDDRLLLAQQLNLPLPPVTDGARQQPNLIDLPLPPLRDVGLKAPIALRYRTRGIDLIKSLPVLELVRDFEAYEDLQIIRLGIHRRSEQPLLLESSQAAQVWTDYLAPEVILDEEPADVDVTVEKAEAVYHVDQGPPRLRVIKVASCCSALPGEEITFTLRFDNIGEQTIGNVTLLDNLTTRLEYIPDTAQCSLKAEFFAEDNQGESLQLRWEIRDPLKPGEGGIIRFRCRVR